jgi:citrate lyase subunit beta/citryl-CoA lyase
MRIRRTLLFVPGNNPGMLSSSPVLGADAVIFDLEDSVAEAEKDAARVLVRNALAAVPFEGVERIVRINSLETEHWRADLDEIMRSAPDCVLLPKASRAADVVLVADVLAELEAANGLAADNTGLLVILESALGMERAFEIATAHPRLQGMLLGGEDLAADLGAKRTKSGEELLYARGRILMAARAAGVQAFDTPFTDTNDPEGLAADAALACRMGFDGKALISPHHVFDANRLFTPSEDEVEWAERVLAASDRARAEGKGAVSLDGMMVDAPILRRAERTLRLAELGKGRLP